MGKDWEELVSKVKELFPNWDNEKSCTRCIHTDGWCEVRSSDVKEKIYMIYCGEFNKPIGDFLTEAESCHEYCNKSDLQ
ncbi:hypothetical protein [Paenibacillus cremeus]|uniref:Uncharacterized protein n=1 Tax=Paenibacillus cremeus TaxID=2163881 RepID=A0A559KCL3_9BACL|nr:hypothetical protein [Paenibacillus cremeus]TVY09868.1 hypothetical protein FPZ49_10880 [Paenibacillus cremeus]